MNKLERSLKKLNKRIATRTEMFHVTHSPIRALFSSKSPKKSSRLSIDCASLSTQESLEDDSAENTTIKTTADTDITELNIDETTEDLTSDDTTSIATTSENVGRQKSLLGLAYLPQQVHRKFRDRTFNFTLMVTGRAGLGKSTLVNSLFCSDIYSTEYPGPSMRISPTVTVQSTTMLIKENSFQMNLTVVDTPGFGDDLNLNDCWNPIVKFIEGQHSEYLKEEMAVRQRDLVDKRVHCCLYFIEPSGHRLNKIDVHSMKMLHNKVNIIPVIAKADSMTSEELAAFKQQVMKDISVNKIKIYTFLEMPSDHPDVDSYNDMRSRVPFAVVGSNVTYQENGRLVRGRKYPWGIVDIDNLEHCDFKALRTLVIKHSLCDLVDSTHSVHYENYRVAQLEKAPSKFGNGIKFETEST